MTAKPFAIKFLGQRCTVWRVLDAAGEVVQVCETQAEALAWIAGK